MSLSVMKKFIFAGLVAVLVLAWAGVGSAGAVTIALGKGWYGPNEQIRVTLGNLPGHKQDWLTVVRTGTPADKYGQWFYTNGVRQGTWNFKGLAAGSYEVRVYLDWPKGGYNIAARRAFNVGAPPQAPPPSSGRVSPGAIDIRPSKPSYAPGERIRVSVSGLPGHKQDWLTVVKTGTPADKYGQWFYTKGVRQGSWSFNGLRPGSYEIRVYLDYPKGGYNIVARQTFTVGAAPPPTAAPAPTPAGRIGINLSKPNYGANEEIRVSLSGLPGHKQDWLTVVKTGSPADKYGQWYYTKGVRQGSWSFKGLPVGAYEVRVYLDWPKGGYKIAARQGFRVTAGYSQPKPIAPQPVQPIQPVRPIKPIGPDKRISGVTPGGGSGGQPSKQPAVTPGSGGISPGGGSGGQPGKQPASTPGGGGISPGGGVTPPPGQPIDRPGRTPGRTPGGTPGKGGGAIVIKMIPSAFRASQPFQVQLRNLPGNSKDWIAIAKFRDPANKYGQYFYSNGAKRKTFHFKGLQPGRYEIRVYLNWPQGGFNIVKKKVFQVE